MTGEEEAVLKAYLQHYGDIEDDEDFEAWYMQRYKDAASEDYCKHTLNLAQVWHRRYEEGFQTGVSYQTLCSKQPAELTHIPM